MLAVGEEARPKESAAEKAIDAGSECPAIYAVSCTYAIEIGSPSNRGLYIPSADRPWRATT